MIKGQGRYSLLRRQWVVEPENVAVDDECVRRKADRLKRTIETAMEIGDQDRLDGLLLRLRAFRQSGLEEGGEFSIENLVYKQLRRDGTVQRLRDAARFQYDESLSYSRPEKYAEGFPWEDDDEEPEDLEATYGGFEGPPEEEPGYDDPDEPLGEEDDFEEPPPPEEPPAKPEKPKSWADEVYKHWGSPTRWDEKRNQPSSVTTGGKMPGMTGPEGPGPDATPEAKPAAPAGTPSPAPSAPSGGVSSGGSSGSGAGKWTPYTGPRGGKGWRNAQGDVFYGDDPPGSREAKPSPLADLPVGTEIGGWTKTEVPEWNTTTWSNGETALSDDQMMKFNQDEVQKHLDEKTPQATPQKPTATPPGDSEQIGENPPRQKGVPRELSSAERAAVSGVASAFGIAPGDVHDDARLRNFLTLAARHMGFNPRSVGDDKNEQAVASAVFLEKQRSHLESMVTMAQSYGWKGGKGERLVVRARGAADHMVRTATKMGYQPTGQSSHQQVEGALKFIQSKEQEQKDQPNPINDIMRQVMQKPGKIGLGHVVGAVLGFWFAYSMMKKRGKRRRK